MSDPTNNPVTRPAERDDIDTELAAEGIEWTKDGIVVKRQSWMSDEHWRYMSEQMQAWWDGYSAALVDATRVRNAR